MKKRNLFILASIIIIYVFIMIVAFNPPHISEGDSSSTSLTNDYTSSSYENFSSENESSLISSSSNSLLTSEVNQNIKKIKIYINPSVQTKNLYVNSLGTEAQHMNDLAYYLKLELKDSPYIDTYINDNYKSLKESVSESNLLNCDIHFALHSNAGGGNGYEIYTSNDDHFANYIISDYGNYMKTFKNRGIFKNANLYEIKNSKAKNRALIEVLFHDNYQEASFIVNNKKSMAKVLGDSIKSYVEKFYFNIY